MEPSGRLSPWWFGAPLIPLLYALSVGPMLKAFGPAPWLMKVYWPRDWVYQHSSTAGNLIDHYISYWL